MSVTVRQLAEWVRGEVLGDPELTIANARTLTDAEPGDITFVETEKNLAEWRSSKASVLFMAQLRPYVRSTRSLELHSKELPKV